MTTTNAATTKTMTTATIPIPTDGVPYRDASLCNPFPHTQTQTNALDAIQSCCHPSGVPSSTEPFRNTSALSASRTIGNCGSSLTFVWDDRDGISRQFESAS